jgi:hypothetical protein
LFILCAAAIGTATQSLKDLLHAYDMQSKIDTAKKTGGAGYDEISSVSAVPVAGQVEQGCGYSLGHLSSCMPGLTFQEPQL